MTPRPLDVSAGGVRVPCQVEEQQDCRRAEFWRRGSPRGEVRAVLEDRPRPAANPPGATSMTHPTRREAYAVAAALLAARPAPAAGVSPDV